MRDNPKTLNCSGVYFYNVKIRIRILFKDMGNLNYTRSFFFGLKCTKIVSGWGSAPGPAGGAYSAPPDPLAVVKEGLGERMVGEGRWEGREGRGISHTYRENFAPPGKFSADTHDDDDDVADFFLGNIVR